MKQTVIKIVFILIIITMTFISIFLIINNKGKNLGEYHFFYTLLNIAMVVTFILTFLILYVYILKLTKVEKEDYKRDTENIIEPVLAESIIDGKIDANDLIMTCIVELIYKKKIENLDNDSIKLIDVSDLSDIEKETLKIIFATSSPIEDYKGKIARLSDLNTIFKSEGKRALDIYDRFNEIKKIIKNKLFESKIINPIWNFLLKRIRELSALISLNSIIILCNKPNYLFDYLQSFFYLIIFLNIFVYLCISKKEVITDVVRNKNIRSRRNSSGLILVLYCIFMVLFGVYNLHFMDKETVLSLCFVIIDNLIIFKLSDTYVLTKKGKEEYKKAYMLKKYIIDYSLIEQRDIDGLIIFDDYLIYATAFGIPSKITSKYKENFLNLNIRLQFLYKL